jgi:hypothetical protein
VAIFAVFLLSVLGSAIVLIGTTETAISAHHSGGMETFYAADAGLERTMADLAAAPDWDAVLAGAAPSTFVDGPPSGTRQVAGTTVSLDEATNVLRCGRTSTCADAQMAAWSADRPWGADNPRWQLFGWGWLSQLTGQPQATPIYVIVWVADDPGETDGNPRRDGSADDDPGRGVMWVTVQAYGGRGVRAWLEATVARRNAGQGTPPRFQVVSWRQVR